MNLMGRDSAFWQLFHLCFLPFLQEKKRKKTDGREPKAKMTKTAGEQPGAGAEPKSEKKKKRKKDKKKDNGEFQHD